MNKGRIVIISGPSGSGKTTLHKKLLTSPKLKGRLMKSISVTTRFPRWGERHGRDYLFMPHKQFLQKRKDGYFLEWQKVFDNYYGTPKENVDRLLRAGKNVLLCIDVKGAKVVARQYPDAVRIFVKVPSMRELKKRLQKRGSESAAHLKLRLKTARQELREAKHYTHTIINDQLSTALRRLIKIVVEELSSAHPQCVSSNLKVNSVPD